MSIANSSVPVRGQLVDIHNRKIHGAEVEIRDGRIASVKPTADAGGPYILPGFVDAHVHVESSMLPPAEFGRQAVRHGTVATVSDPHEIANVLGEAGIKFMLDDAKNGPLKICFGASSCVPATTFETAGAVLGVDAVSRLLEMPEIGYLSEVMNYPGVLAGDPDLTAKIAAAVRVGKPVDGHAPGLRGGDAARYAAAGISTDHECVELEEALDKLAAGMWILIREGSAAKNYEALKSLLRTVPEKVMLCTDDFHPDALAEGHINKLVARAVADGADLFDVLRCACVHPVEHYRLPVGLLREGERADFILVSDLETMTVAATYIDGRCVARDGECVDGHRVSSTPNRFGVTSVPDAKAFGVEAGAVERCRVRIIKAENGQLLTGAETVELECRDGAVRGDPTRDILKLAVLNRYTAAPPAVAFVRGFGLRRGAVASSVAHDSHNVIGVGVDDESLARAMGGVVAAKGGLAVFDGGRLAVLPLPIAGLMSDLPGGDVAAGYRALQAMLVEMGSRFDDALMTLSFMALLVIPDLKLSDRGLFSGRRFAFEPLVCAPEA